MLSDIKLVLLQYTYGFIHFTETTCAGIKHVYIPWWTRVSLNKQDVSKAL